MGKKRQKKIGLPPGSIVFTGDKRVEKARIHHLGYNQDELVSKPVFEGVGFDLSQLAENKINWFDLRGIHESDLIESIGLAFGIHPLVLEDVSDVHHRPKFEEYENGIFIIVKALSFDSELGQIETEQVSIFFRKDIVISFQETESDLFATVRERLQQKVGKIRQRGSDYLAYALLDVITDQYFIILENLEERIENLEESLLLDQTNMHKESIYDLQKQLLVAKKFILPMREAIARFKKSENEDIDEANTIFFRDLYDHIVHLLDMIDSMRDTLYGHHDLFVSEVSLKTNKVMQLLTLIATIFIPLTFLVGVYGMNFQNMPELTWKYGYFGLLTIMFGIFLGLLWYFKRKKWL